MLSLLAVNFEPQLRGIIIVAIAVGVLIGGTYLVVGTNLGARLGFLVVLAGLFGWMAIMGSIWWTYGIGLKGREPSWQPGEPTTIVRSSDLLDDAEIMLTPMQPSGDAVADAAAASTALQSEGWLLLQESDPRRGQAMLRDLGSKRQPAIFITIGSLIIFLLLCRLLHVRDLRLRENLTADSGSRSSAKS
ncbi:MAG: hypothetical protein EBU68_04200 [Actinobacteria bacterium]|nr:hypothetical protein [Actinomycetota bacterium]